MLFPAMAIEPLQIISQPQSQTAMVGGEATFSVTVSGDSPHYEWWFNGAPIPGATNATYNLDNVQATNAGNYAVGVFNDATWIASSVANLKLVSPPAIAAIPDQTTDANVPLGPLTVSIEGWSAPLGNPTLTASSSNTNLIPTQNILFGGTGTNRTMTIVPDTNGSGLCYITINVTGAYGASASTTFALNVNHVNQPPQFVGDPPIIAQPYQLYSYTVNVTDPDPDDTLQVTAQVPSWLSFDPATRVLSGTPPRGGPQGDGVTLTVTDGVTPPVVKQFTIYTADDIALTNATDVEIKRRALIDYIWGPAGWPTNRVPADVQPGFTNETYDSLYNEEGNLSHIDLYTVKMAYGLESKVYHFHPIHGNGRLFIYHAGHNWRGFIGDDVDGNNQGQNPGLVIPALLKEGFSVLAFDMPIYTSYPLPRVSLPWTTEIMTIDSHPLIFSYLERPFSFFFEPVVVALNYVQDNYDYKSVYMTGFSGGGWMSSLYPALDPRIERSYAVAGSEPNYLRIGYEGLGDAEQDDNGFYRIANYKEFYTMSALGLNRLQLQILNRYDACCHYGDRYTNWVDEVKSKVQQLGAGRYDFYSDTTHHDHKISTNALAVILNSFPPTLDALSNRTVAINAGPQIIGLSGIGPASPVRTAGLSVSAMSDDPELTGELAVSYRDSDSFGSLSFKPQTDVAGVAHIFVTVKDAISDDAIYTRAFTVTVKSLGIPPVVQWIGPADRTTLEPLQPVILQAAAGDADGTVAGVEFRDGTNSLGVVSNPPYNLVWSNPTVGTHTLSAVATDDRGGSSTSETALLTVLPLNQTPIVQWLSPANESVLQQPQPVTLQAAASDADGAVVRVEFRDGTNSLGVVSNPPYDLVWSNPTVGTHTLTAVAVDDRAGATISEVALLTVLPLNQLPIVQWLSPTNGLALDTPSPVTLEVLANDPDGSIAQVEFRDGTNSLGVVTNSQSFSLIRDHLGAGTHALSAIVTDNRGGRTETPLVTITIQPPNQAPTVQWLSPTNGAVLDASAAIVLEAAAADPDGNVARVEFRDGTNSLGMVTSPPYSLVWTNPPAGTRTLSAITTDHRGVVVTDSIVVAVVYPRTTQVPLIIRSVEMVSNPGSSLAKSSLQSRLIQLHIQGPDGSVAVIEASTDLGTWSPISTNALVNGTFVSTDSESANFNLRFYRVRVATQTP
jgi:hypothetical protein